MSGAFLENLNNVHPGLNAVLGNSSELRGTVRHIIDKSRSIRKEKGLHALSVDQLLLMMAYYEGLAKKHDEKIGDNELTFWHSDRSSIYFGELYRRGVSEEGNPDRDRYLGVVRVLWRRQKDN